MDGKASIQSNISGNIYIDSLDDPNRGYIGSTWNTPFGTNYRITNVGIFKWDDTCTNQNDNSGWKWIGFSGLTYQFSADKKSIEIQVRKDVLGDLNAKTLKTYMHVEDATSWIGNLVKPIQNGDTNNVGFFEYTQKSYKPNTPHGWYCSDEINIDSSNPASLSWAESTPQGTSVQAWVRTRTDTINWIDWVSIKNGDPIVGTFTKVQYCFGLNTNSGDVSPSVENIQIQR